MKGLQPFTGGMPEPYALITVQAETNIFFHAFYNPRAVDALRGVCLQKYGTEYMIDKNRCQAWQYVTTDKGELIKITG